MCNSEKSRSSRGRKTSNVRYFSLLKTIEAGLLSYINHVADPNVKLLTDLFDKCSPRGWVADGEIVVGQVGGRPMNVGSQRTHAKASLLSFGNSIVKIG